MAKHFYKRQDNARRTSSRLVMAFVVLLLLMAVFIHLFVVTASAMLGNAGHGLWAPSVPAMVFIGLLWCSIAAGCLFRWIDVRSGGAALAERFGAVEVVSGSRQFEQRRLLNVVAEMAIASGLPQPRVYMLPFEQNINAMVLGRDAKQCVIVVTQGALSVFDRDELQAVVAHEFAHIKNGDLALNMNLLVALGGLLALDDIGRLLIGGDLEQDDHIPIGMIAGLLFRIPGTLGSVAGMLLRAAVVRQREFLADATAVQLCRRSLPLAQALDRIRQDQAQHALRSHWCNDLAHLCFQNGARLAWYRKLLATHPPLDQRIKAIDPHFAVKQRKAREQSERSAEQGLGVGAESNVSMLHDNPVFELAQGELFGPPQEPLSGRQPGGSIEAGREASALRGASTHSASGLSLVGTGDNHGELASDINTSGLSDRVLLMVPDASACLAMIFALFSSADKLKRRDYFNAIAFTFNQELANQVEMLTVNMQDEIREKPLKLLNHATAMLMKETRRDSRQVMLLRLEKLLVLSGRYTLQRYATMQLVRRKLGVDFPVLDKLATGRRATASGSRVKRFDSMADEFALLLSLVVEASGSSESEQQAQFERMLRTYTHETRERRSAEEAGIVVELERAFQTLYVQPESIRNAFVRHCLEIAQSDGKVVQGERLIVDLYAAALGCESMALAA